MSVIPDSWIETELGHVADSIQYGHTAKSSSENIGPHFLRITDIQDGGVDWSTVPYCCVDQRDIAKYSLIADDLVFARTGATVGKSFLIRGEIPESVFASYLIRVRLSTALAPQFTYYFFQSGDYWRQISDSSSGIGQPNVNGTKLAALRLPLPPLAEQRRIVAKIEELFSELDAGEESLRRARRQLGVYRQSLLKQAFEGKLTEPWRKQHTTAANPQGTTLAELVEIKSGNGFPVHHQGEEDGEFPFYKVGDISKNAQAGRRRLGRANNYISSVVLKKIKGTVIPVGATVFAKIGAAVALNRRAITSQPCLIDNNAMALIPRKMLDTDFLYLFMRQIDLGEKTRGGAVPSLRKGDIEEIPILLPSLPEQQEIVRLLDEQFTVIEQNEREIDVALKRSAALRQSILKKAFTGQLVPQDPADEPAAALLERIRKERENSPKQPKKIIRKRSLKS